jgi:hypothetical protein
VATVVFKDREKLVPSGYTENQKTADAIPVLQNTTTADLTAVICPIKGWSSDIYNKVHNKTLKKPAGLLLLCYTLYKLDSCVYAHSSIYVLNKKTASTFLE